MKRQLAFVLGGGGARGALQVGALRALLQAGYQPDLLAGTSVGAINATFLALRGLNQQGIGNLTQAWYDAALADLLPKNYLWLTVRSLFRRSEVGTSHRLRDFILAHGLEPDLRFGDIQGVRLILVAADLNHGCATLYGLDLHQSVLEGLLASTALPPWVAPIEVDDQLLMDGGIVSNLPIQPAMEAGATEIIAMDLVDPGLLAGDPFGFGTFLNRLLFTIDCRQRELEMALAAARRVPVRYIHLSSDQPVPVWDFLRTEELIERGYQLTQGEILRWQAEHPPGFWSWLKRIGEKR